MASRLKNGFPSLHKGLIKELKKEKTQPYDQVVFFFFRQSKTNALDRAYSISTCKELYPYSKSILVSIPLVGLFTFQCSPGCRRTSSLRVSMPCIGLIPFLLTLAQQLCPTRNMFQCPESGLSHFYREQDSKISNQYRFQCPESSLSHFYDR